MTFKGEDDEYYKWKVSISHSGASEAARMRPQADKKLLDSTAVKGPRLPPFAPEPANRPVDVPVLGSHALISGLKRSIPLANSPLKACCVAAKLGSMDPFNCPFSTYSFGHCDLLLQHGTLLISGCSDALILRSLGASIMQFRRATKPANYLYLLLAPGLLF